MEVLTYSYFPLVYLPIYLNEQQFWTNLFPTELLAKHASEIKRFKWVIRFMRWFEIFFAVIPIKVSLKMFFFSDE